MEGNPATPVLVGPTATGKTDLLLELRERHDFQVISADSRQIYRWMDIGTAKPTTGERERLRHHLVDFMDPDQSFSAGDFERKALELEKAIRSEGSLPLVAGGTALYVMALTGGLDPLPQKCAGVRNGFLLIEEERPGYMWELLCAVDPVTAGAVGPGDLRRQTRALEIRALSGLPAGTLRKGGDPARRDRYIIAGIRIPAEEHRRRIEIRTRRMLETGLVEETRSLLQRGWGRESALGRTIGYSETMDYLDGAIGSMEELLERIATNTWRLARRQKNMFGRIRGIKWSEGDPGELERILFAEGGG